MSVSTKTGDNGTTALLYGQRVAKTHLRVVAYGRVDELASALGLCRAHCDYAGAKKLVHRVQKELVHMMSELATDDVDQTRFLQRFLDRQITEVMIENLNQNIHEKEARAGGFKGWSYPGNTIADAFFDSARTTCRRAERGLVAVQQSGAMLRPELLQYLNRLSDLLWLLGREHA
jgi:cob(I)alamin adenosyltransferase